MFDGNYKRECKEGEELERKKRKTAFLVQLEWKKRERERETDRQTDRGRKRKKRREWEKEKCWERNWEINR